MVLGVVAAACFASSFVLNRMMSTAGGSWMWTASLRYLFMLAPMVVLVAVRGGLGGTLRSLRARPGTWLLWSTVGFGLFYAPLAWASTAGAGWLVASTWQLTLVAGLIIGALGGHGGLPVRTLVVSLLIVLGVALAQVAHAEETGWGAVVRVVAPVLVAAFAYPLGNRRLLGVDGLDGFQRTLAMTVGSLPLWLVMAATAWATDGPPSGGQTLQSAIVALASGVVATTLFFRATDLVRHRPDTLGAVEATQAAEVPFTLLGEALLIGVAAPDVAGWAGLALIVAGLCAHALGGALPARRRTTGEPPLPGPVVPARGLAPELTPEPTPAPVPVEEPRAVRTSD
ncbi:hypothetical protein B1H18_04545 [Streptomyces tsukubensis]|uniref:Multidrug resistance efflux transporter family protein n=2 Tax=Streptomyces tsukubensis TaxID=83656 RepID=A0A1V4AF84_9ACTN|nr:hypothetical protein B1H18_04545 [Streptomyces tsukubensis]